MFNVLDGAQNIHRHHLIEASAGTGKTFTIENLVVRLLLEPSTEGGWIPLEKIIVVTFTREATRDLRNRILNTLVTIRKILNEYIRTGDEIQNSPHYLLSCLQTATPQTLLKKIDEAIFNFDQAYIDTIHGFCAKILSQYALECGESLNTKDSEETLHYKDALMKAIDEFLRTGISPKKYSKGQLRLLLNAYTADRNTLQEKLQSVVEKNLEIQVTGSLDDHLEKFYKAIKTLKTKYNSKLILEDFFKHAPNFNGILKKNKQIKEEVLEKAKRFAALFEKNSWTIDDFDTLISDGLIFLDLFKDSNRSKRGSLDYVLHYPNLNHSIENELGPCILPARNVDIIFANIAKDCQLFTEKILEENEIFTHNSILTRMKKAIGIRPFAEKIRDSFHAVIVDEFQDTDPIQWEIFSSLFLQKGLWKGNIYLVGDPKQSIYSFRQADIYTYLSAAKELREGSIVTLDTNYRSHTLLVDGVNTLFNAMRFPFPLPLYNDHLSYKNVLAGKDITLPFSDNRTCMEFWLTNNEKEVESDVIIPALIQELISLEKQGIANSRCAILVRNHSEADLIEKMLGDAGISVKKQRGSYLGSTEAIHCLTDILKGIYNYKNRSHLVHALTTRPIGWIHNDILRLEKSEVQDQISYVCSSLREILIEQGFGCFYRSFMDSVWRNDGKSVLEYLLSQKNSKTFYRNWQDLADLIALKYNQEHLSYDSLLDYLQTLQNTLDNEEDELKGYLDQDDEGVMLMTHHISKGLEFDVVFALGLNKRYKGSDALIPVSEIDPISKKTRHYLTPVIDDSCPKYQLYKKELEAEMLRQLYVVLTRARYRVYIPIVLNKDEIKNEQPSPVDLMINNLVPENSHTLDGFCLFVESYPKLMNYHWLEKGITNVHSTSTKKYALIKPPEVSLNIPIQLIQSFTSMTKNSVDTISLDEIAPGDFENIEKNAHTLPAGNETGIILHTIFEHISFEEIAKAKEFADIVPLIAPFVRGTSYEPWKYVLANIVFSTLKLPLPSPLGTFCLADVSSHKCYKEAPFMFNCQDGFIKGVIDLFFEHEGYYYIVDWKSNWLGGSQERYTPEKVQQAMKEHSYEMQAEIYKNAIKKYLKIVDSGHFESIFGGIFYIFVRNPSIWSPKSILLS